MTDGPQDPEFYEDEDDDALVLSDVSRRRGCGLPGCLAVLVALAVLVGGGWFALNRGIDAISDRLSGPEDYPGPGTGQVLVQVREGDTGADIGNLLKTKGVVKSVEAFTEAFSADPDSAGVQVGYYQLKKQMKAEDAVEVLVDSGNLIQSTVTIPEGFRIDQIVDRIASETKITPKALNAALSKPETIGLPAEAKGNPEGYLFPSTYTVVPGETAKSLLSKMVDETQTQLDELGVSEGAEANGLSVEELMTLASILEYEGFRDADLPKIARVFYNRLDQGMALQSDATVAYANGVTGTVWTTDEQRANPSRYNTYQHTGLPPGPIGSPGARTIEAAINPADGDWLFFVPINLETGETKFSETLAEHNKYVEQLRTWCAETDSPNCD